MQNQQDENRKTFPRAVYKRGTGKDEGGGKYTAESTIVKSEEELSRLGGDWVASPSEAATDSIGANPLTGANARTGSADTDDSKHHAKKAK